MVKWTKDEEEQIIQGWPVKEHRDAIAEELGRSKAACATRYSKLIKETPVEEKALRIATRLYGADGINIQAKADRQLKQIQSWGYGNLPVCMAKTQYSFSHDANLLGAPTGFEIPIREFRLNSGAGFIVAVLGEIMTMPGLPKRPAAADMDMDEDGNLLGVFG